MTNRKNPTQLLPMLATTVFIGTFLALWLGIPHTLRSWETNDLYLETADYLRDAKSMPHPILQLATDYIRQFFHTPAIGAAMLSAVPTVTFLLLSFVVRNRIVRAVTAALLVGGTLAWVCRPQVRWKETMNHLEQAAENRRWKEVLDIVTPKMASEHPELMPYAMLALAINNELTDKMLTYPIRSIKDFDTQGNPCHEFYFFKMVLYDCIGCPNEAIHCNFQAAAGTTYGTTFGTLRRMVRFCEAAGYQTLADKYREILSHSTMHRSWAPKRTAVADTLQTNQSGHIPVITKDFGFNLALFMDLGIRTPQVCNYFLCAMLARRDLKTFATTLPRLRPMLPQPLPPLYQEALQLYAGQHPGSDLSEYGIQPGSMVSVGYRNYYENI